MRIINHEHNYVKCLLHDTTMDTYYLSSYCTICGKIRGLAKDSDLIENEENECYRMLTDEELLDEYKDLKIFDFDILKDKYINKER